MEQGQGAERTAPAGLRTGAGLRHGCMRLLPPFLLMLALAAPAQASDDGPLEVTQRTMHWQGATESGSDAWYRDNWAKGSIVMPYVTSSRKDVAARINDELYMGLIGIPAPSAAGANFELTIPADDSALVGTSSLEFELARDDEHIFSVAVTQEGCGAYCENYTTHYHFDATTGRPFAAAEVITSAGKKDIVKRMDREALGQYRKMLKTLQADLALQLKTGKPSQPGGSVDDTRDRIELNEHCLQEALERQQDSSRNLDEDFRYLAMAIPDDKGVSFRHERCSNHASRALDDVGDVNLPVPNAQLRGMLTDYGRFLFSGGDRPREALDPFGVFLHGRIGQSPIALRIAVEKGSQQVSAVYYYDKYRRPIALTGTADGDRFTLTTSKTDKDAETFELVRHGSTLAGQWHKGNALQPVSVGP